MTLNELNQLAEDFLRSRKNSNSLIDLIDQLKNSTTHIPCILALNKVYCETFRKQILVNNDVSENETEKIYKKWFLDCYEETFKKILNLIKKSPELTVQKQALSSLMNILVSEATYYITKEEKDHLPVDRLKEILKNILLTKLNSNELVIEYTQYIHYDDIYFYTWRIIKDITKDCKPTDTFIKNLLFMIGKFSIKDSDKTNENICKSDNHQFILNNNLLNKYIKVTSKNIIKWKLSSELIREVLLIIVEKLIPIMDYPVFLTDYLMESMSLGDAIGVLGLQGMFLLIQKYNLEYPKIYNKLYLMINQEIFNTKFKSRLYYLTNIFLSSSHLPEQLMAAYAKKFARLALVAPLIDIEILLSFIGNLIIRHKGLRKMLIAKPTDINLDKDPYLFNEENPYESHALESYLWEVYNLQNHFYPTISKLATKLINTMDYKVEFDINSLLDYTDEEIFEKQIKKKKDDKIPITYLRPTSLHLPEGDKMFTFWKMD